MLMGVPPIFKLSVTLSITSSIASPFLTHIDFRNISCED